MSLIHMPAFISRAKKNKRDHLSPFSPPDLVHDSEDDSDSHCRSSSPRPRKSTPHKSPSVSSIDTSIVFQLIHTVRSTPQPPQPSILSTLRKKIAYARSLRTVKRTTREPSYIILPRRNITKIRQHYHDRLITEQTEPNLPKDQNLPKESKEPNLPKKRKQNDDILPSPNPKKQKRDRSYAGRPSKPKGPCEACNDNSDGCMRKAFDWPFESQQVFYDKGRPYVYLCNKCGLRYNKSAGSVCRNCRWVVCKEEKRKALQHIDNMRSNQTVTLDDDIENFYCSPKYWVCDRPWKVGWVLNSLEEEYSS
ncbi:hypothetical protein HPULCUR_005036 [Helicostylum pulchrum]|uniref:GATA-type domain-containing protein n=1 Tax=Helicostylum pulchrum TaxID=562976 RepID=A0ABP9XY04_9FUNG